MPRVKCENCLHRNVCSTIEYSNDAEEYVDEYGCSDFFDESQNYKLPIIPDEQIIYVIIATWQFGRILDYHIEERILNRHEILQGVIWDWFGNYYFLTKEDAVKRAEEYMKKGVDIINVRKNL